MSRSASAVPPRRKSIAKTRLLAADPVWNFRYLHKMQQDEENRVYTVARTARALGAVQVRCVFRRSYGSLTFDVPPSEASRWRAISRVLRSPLDTLSCALFPASCALCGSPLPRLSAAPVCDSCWSECSEHTIPRCARCGEFLPAAEFPESKSFCRACRLAPPPFERAVSFGPYRDPLRSAIHLLKYSRMRPVARQLGTMLVKAIAQLRTEAPGELLVVPMPLHRSRRRQRGFNQAEEMAAFALKALRKNEPGWKLKMAPRSLMRILNTQPQAGLTMRQRRINMSRAFSVADAATVRDRNLLLIDDVLTTGATARSAARELLRAGASAVWVATLARAARIHSVHRDSFEDDPQPLYAAASPVRLDSLHGQSSF